MIEELNEQLKLSDEKAQSDENNINELNDQVCQQ